MKNNKSKAIHGFKLIFFRCLIIIIVIALVWLIFRSVYGLIKNPTSSFAVRQGTISKEENDIGYIIRDETIVVGKNYKNGMQKNVDEGQKAAKGENIFRYYSTGEDKLKNQIAELDKQIEELMQENTEEQPSADIKLLNKNIENQLSTVNSLNNIHGNSFHSP